MNDKNPKKVFFCSTLASIICNVLTNPLDVVKVRLQNDAKKCGCIHPSLCCTRSSPSIRTHSVANASVLRLIKTRNIEQEFRVQCDCLPFKTNTKALIYLARKEGVRTLANGIKHGVFASTVSAVTFFSSYEAVRKEVTKCTRNVVFVPLFSALLARTFTTSLIFPFEYWRTVQQSVVGSYSKSSVKIGRHFNAGFGSLLLRDIVFACINWILIENIRRNIKEFVSIPNHDEMSYQNKETLLLSNFISGGIAGGIASYLSIPFDVVKTRKQLHPREYRHKSTMQILNEVYQAEGKKGLFLGARQRGWKVTIQTAGVLTLYELFIDMLRDRQLELKLM